ncbi:TPA: hypothetical protein ACODIZ_003643 [Salmonella enterica subsp. enterica serovar Newport]
MADTLTSLVPGDKLPDTLPAFPDKGFAFAWAEEHGGKIPAYGKDAQGTIVLLGYWHGNAPLFNHFYGILQHSTIPPQWREVDSKTAFEINNNDPSKRTFTIDPQTKEKVWTDHPGNNGMTNQPNWNWAPKRPKDKPNKLNH